MNKMRNDQKYFMQQGRTEFNKQLNKWQDFFDETYDDYYEMENRLEKLETFVEIMSGNLEDLECDWHIQCQKQQQSAQGSLQRDSQEHSQSLDAGMDDSAAEQNDQSFNGEGDENQIDGQALQRRMTMSSVERRMAMAFERTRSMTTKTKTKMLGDSLKAHNLMAIQESNAEQNEG